MYFTGFADEASAGIDGQIEATLELGWKNIETRNIDGVNIHDISDENFEEVLGKLNNAGISINCFGSAVANWGKDPFKEEDFLKTIEELKRALVRMKKANCSMIRGMSFKAQWNRAAFDAEVEEQVFKKVAYLVKMCEDAGVTYLHENCNNYGGMSYKHALKLIEKIDSPNFKLVFDTGNPTLNFDRSKGDKLEGIQSSWEYYSNIKEFIRYIHIKDAIFQRHTESGFAEGIFTYPGEGQGDVVKIINDLIANGYDGGFSIEPHMASVFHDENEDKNNSKGKENYIEYGKRFMKIVETAIANNK